MGSSEVNDTVTVLRLPPNQLCAQLLQLIVKRPQQLDTTLANLVHQWIFGSVFAPRRAHIILSCQSASGVTI